MDKENKDLIQTPEGGESADAKTAARMKARREAMLRKQAEERKAQEQRKKIYIAIGVALVLILAIFGVSSCSKKEDPNVENQPGISQEVENPSDTNESENVEADENTDETEDTQESDETAAGEGDEQAADNHVHSYKEAITEPTHTKDGFTTFTCSECGDEKIEKIVKAEGHKYDVTVVKPTCTEKGYSVYECKCGDKFTDNELKAAGHKYVEILKKATCTSGGHTTYECTVCDYSFIDDKKPALEHDYEEKVVKPTYTAGGYTEYTCTHCGDTYKGKPTDKLEKEEDKEENKEHEHVYTASVTKPTCTKDGYTTYKCSCGEKYTDDVTTMTGHSYSETVMDPTCTDGGYHLHKCSACGDSYKSHEIEPLPHDYKETVLEQETCTLQGVHEMACVRCPHKYNKTVDKLGHDYKEYVVEPTCEDAGYTSYGCTRCYDSYVEENSFVSALGHSFEKEVTEPTITENGKIVFTCTCEDCEKVIEVPTAPYDEIWAYEGQDFEGECPKFTEETAGTHYHTNTHFINGDYVLHYCSAVEEIEMDYENGIIYLPFPNFCPDKDGVNVGIKHEHRHETAVEDEYTVINCTWISKEIVDEEAKVKYRPLVDETENPVNTFCQADDDTHNHREVLDEEDNLTVMCDKVTTEITVVNHIHNGFLYPSVKYTNWSAAGFETEAGYDAAQAPTEPEKPGEGGDNDDNDEALEDVDPIVPEDGYCQVDDETHKHREMTRGNYLYVFCEKYEYQAAVDNCLHNGVEYKAVQYTPWKTAGVLTEIEFDVECGKFEEEPVDADTIEGICLEADGEHKHIAYLKDEADTVYMFCEKCEEAKMIVKDEQKIVLCPFEFSHCEDEDGLRAVMEWYNTHIIHTGGDINYNEWELPEKEPEDKDDQDDNDDAVKDYDPTEDAAICEADDDSHNHIETVEGEFTYIFCEKVEEVQVIEDVKYMPWKYLGFENEDAYYDSLKKDEPEIVNEEESVEEETPTETEPSQEPEPTE